MTVAARASRVSFSPLMITDMHLLPITLKQTTSAFDIIRVIRAPKCQGAHVLNEEVSGIEARSIAMHGLVPVGNVIILLCRIGDSLYTE